MSINAISQSNLPTIAIQSGHATNISAMALSSDNKLMATESSDGVINVWDYSTRKILYTIKSTPRWNPALRFANETQVLLCKDGPGTVTLHDIRNRKSLGTFIYRTKSSNPDIQFNVSQDGKKLYLASFSDSIQIFDIPTRKWIESIKEPCRVYGFYISNDGKTMYLGGVDRENTKKGYNSNTTLYVMDMVTKSIKTKVLVGKDLLNDITISKDESMLALALNDNTARVIDLKTLKELKKLEGHTQLNYNGNKQVLNVRFSNDNKQLLTLGRDNRLISWDIKKGTINKQIYDQDMSTEILRTGLVNTVISPYFSNDGWQIVAAVGKEVRIWSSLTGEIQNKFMGYTSPVTALCFSPNSEQLAIGYADATIKVFDLTKGKISMVLRGHAYPIMGVAFSQNGKMIATMDEDVKIKLWDIEKGNTINTTSLNWEKSFSKGENKFILRDFQFVNNDATIIGRLTVFSSSAIDPNAFTWNTNEEHPSLKAPLLSSNKEYAETGIVTYHSGSYIVRSGSYDSKIYYKKRSSDGTFGLGETALCSYTGQMNAGALSKTGNILVTGGDDMTLNVWDLDTKKNQFSLNGHESSIMAIDISANGIIASGGMDNAVKLWDINTGELLATIYNRSVAFFSKKKDNRKLTNSAGNYVEYYVNAEKEYADKFGLSEDYLIMNKEGYYLTTKGGLDLVGFTIGLSPVRFDQFDFIYNRPDLVLKSLRMVPEGLLKAYEMAYKKRVQKQNLGNEVFLQKWENAEVPELTIQLSEGSNNTGTNTGSTTWRVPIEVYDKKTGIAAVHIYANGVPVFNGKGLEMNTNPGQRIKKDIELTLLPGNNVLELAAENKMGAKSLAQRIEVFVENLKPAKPDLYIVTIGVSKFKQADYNLTFAAKDAKDMISAFTKKTDIYGTVYPIELLNENSNREQILQTKETLRKSKENDVVLVFIASHGLLDDNLDYFLATSDINFESPSQRGLRYEELESLLQDIPSRQKILLIDACHSGEVDKEEIAVEGGTNLLAKNISARGFKKIVSAKNSLGLYNSFDLMQTLFSDFRKGSGTIVISAAGGKEYALESNEWNNGVFTYAMLEGLTTYNADRDKDQQVSVSELKAYIFKRVIELTGGKQNPTSRADNLDNDFRVW